MEIDAATRANLELTRTLSRRARRLAAGHDRPHRDARRRAAACRAARRPADRSGAIAAARCGRWFLPSDGAARRRCARALAAAPDMARALSRLALGRGGPRDLAPCATGLRGRRRWRLRAANDARANAPSCAARCRALQPHRSRASIGAHRPWLADDLPLLNATAVSCAPASMPRSTKRARCATKAAA